MLTTKTILVADEDAGARAFLSENLEADGYSVLVAFDRAKAMALLVKEPDLIVVDVNGQTLALIDALRAGDGLAAHADPATPVIALTAKADAVERVRLLERGGDDVVQKPYSYPELRARVQALLRRSAPHQSGVLRVGRLRLDTCSRRAVVGECPVQLTSREYELLRALAAQPGRVLTRGELLSGWGYGTAARTRTLDTHVARLRRKLTAAGAGPMLVNVWGVGYRLDPLL
ncbi:MAG: response regulator transcription factor [Conexibacteraceae bacterium]|nr:response regulator transcription factor [Conexibacteraceae bacterium]